MLNTEKEILKAWELEGKPIYQIVIEEEHSLTKKNEDEIRSQLKKVIDVMNKSATHNINREVKGSYNMVDSFSKKTFDYSQREKDNSLTGEFINRIMAYAFSTSELNFNMGKIVAAPTAGSSGIMPAAILAAKEKYEPDDRLIENGLLTSIGIGQIIAKYATFAGAEGGCQAECGAAASMAAAALVEIRGGTPKQCLSAASIALVNVLGLVCDPIAGLVEYPCVFRNASGVVNAMISADMAMADITSVVPFEEVVKAMGEVGKLMDSTLRETGLGGLAGTKTGCRIREEFLQGKKGEEHEQK